MEAVERMRPAEQERHFDGQLRFWRDRYRAEGLAEGHAGGLAEGHAGGLAEGHAKGLAEGLARERQLLLRQATRKYGAGGAAGIADLLNGVDDAAQLDEMGEWIIDCATGTDFIVRANRAGNGRD